MSGTNLALVTSQSYASSFFYDVVSGEYQRSLPDHQQLSLLTGTAPALSVTANTAVMAQCAVISPAVAEKLSRCEQRSKDVAGSSEGQKECYEEDVSHFLSGVKVGLEAKCLWEEFCDLGTEMIVTKAGR